MQPSHLEDFCIHPVSHVVHVLDLRCRWHQSNGGTSSTLSLYSLTFLRWYISYDSSLKRCLKDTFLLPLLTCVFLSWPFHFPPTIWSWPVWLCCLRCECCFDSKQHRLYPTLSAMFNFDTKDFHWLVLCVQTTHKSSQVELETCDEIWTSSN